MLTGALSFRTWPMLALMLLIMPDVKAESSVSGFFNLGIREVDISGDKHKYKQHENLDSGPRLFHAGFNARLSDVEQMTPDQIELEVSGLGGDPYQFIRMDIRKQRAYRFKYERTESDYFYQDVLFDPQSVDHEASIAGDFHIFDFNRVRENASLDIRLTDRADFTFGFENSHKSGHEVTVFDISREEFELDKPVDTMTENIELGLAYRWDKVTLTINERWRELDDDSRFILPGASMGSDPDSPTALDFFFLDTPYDYDAREHQINIASQPTKKWRLSADFLFTKLDMDTDAEERSGGNDFTGTPFERHESGEGGADRDIRQVILSSLFDLSERFTLTADWRMRELSQDGFVGFDGLDASSDWEIDSNSLSIGVVARLARMLTMSGGLSLEERETDQIVISSEGDHKLRETVDSEGYWLEINYRPIRNLNLRLSIEENSIDDPLILASPTDTQRIRFKARYRWNRHWSVSASHQRQDRENDLSGWTTESRQQAVRLGYDSERLNISMGLAFVEVDRDIDQLVAGGFRRDLFQLSYRADSDNQDINVNWRVNNRLGLFSSYREYDNDGSFSTGRQEARFGFNFTMPGNYQLRLVYRDLDFKEEPMESFDAQIWELDIGYRW